MLTLSGVSRSFDGRPALVDVTLSVPTRSRTAVVGVNGSGKSTLLSIVAGALTPDRGTVALAPGSTVVYVPQDYGVADGTTVGEFLKVRGGILDAERRLRDLERALAERPDAGTAEAYADALDRFDTLGGYEIEGRIDRALADLRLPSALLDRPLGELSGGQQVRVGLAGMLASRFSLYLLDEPTNNLDLFALDLLERFVTTTDATFLLVSHDRAFLDAVATDVVEIDEQTHTAEIYGVTYAVYRDLRQQALAARSKRYREYVAEVDRLQAAVRTARVAASRTKDRRTPRDNDKFAPHFFAQTAAKRAGNRKRALERRLERLEEAEEPRTGWELRLSLEAASRSGDLVAEVHEVVRHLGAFTLGPLSFGVGWRERIALQGHNGAGKSVLLDVLTGAAAPDAGRVRLGPSVQVGVLRQGGVDLAEHGTGLAAFLDAVPMGEADARTLLAKFGLGADHVLRPVGIYSPGERCRLGLAVLMAQGANWLVLDEPTNHLDIEATEELEQALTTFGGTLLVVSHDREFLARVGVTRRLELADGRLVRDDPH